VNIESEERISDDSRVLCGTLGQTLHIEWGGVVGDRHGNGGIKIQF
jgi:hypothetical protein